MTEEEIQQAILELDTEISELSFLNDEGQHSSILDELECQRTYLIQERNKFHEVEEDDIIDSQDFI